MLSTFLHCCAINLQNFFILENWNSRDFPGGPVAKTPRSQCRGPGFDPWSGNWILHAATKSSHAAAKKIPHAATKTWHSQINK